MSYTACVARARALAWVLLFGACGLAEAATFLVNTSADPGNGVCNANECTLREAIAAANADSGADTINFAIANPPFGTLLIQPGSPLPTILHPLTINGYSQSGTAPNADPDVSDARLRIRVDGLNAGSAAHGLAICGDSVRIAGLSITRFGGHGLAFGQAQGGDCANPPPSGPIADQGEVFGNFIGLSTDARLAGGNGGSGIHVHRSIVAIGSPSVADRNVVSANRDGVTTEAVDCFGNPLRCTKLENNLIGSDRSGALPRGNVEHGVLIRENSRGVRIRSSNRLAFNPVGVELANSATISDITIAGEFADTGFMAIDLGGNGPTSNDSGDADTGPNGLQNFPTISQVERTALGLRLQGSLLVPPGPPRDYALSIYHAPSCAQENGRRIAEASRSLGAGFPGFEIDTILGAPLPAGGGIFMTATGAEGTSELSACVALDPAPRVVTHADDVDDGNCDVSHCSLREALNAANAAPDLDTIHFAIPAPASGEILIQPTSALPAISQPVTIDGYSQAGAAPNNDPAISNAVLRIRLDGALSPGLALQLCTQQITVRGLSITRFLRAMSSCAGITVSHLVLEGNFLGLDTAGAAAGNLDTGLHLEGNLSSNVHIGGSEPAQRNVISGNAGHGVVLAGVSPEGAVPVRVFGNMIGTSPSGIGPRPNGRGGILVRGAHRNHQIGGPGGEANRIAFNGGNGLTLAPDAGPPPLGISAWGNVFFQSAGLGIDLDDDGPTANDDDDSDGGSNGRQNAPELQRAQIANGSIAVRGRLDVPAGSLNAMYRIALYGNGECDPGGRGEGQIPLGTEDVSLSDLVREGFDLDVDASEAVALGASISATATGIEGTSEFSECIVLTEALPGIAVNSSSDDGDGSCDATECTLREAINVANSVPGADLIRFDLPGEGPFLIPLDGPLPPIIEAVTIDGYTQPGAAPNASLSGFDAVIQILLRGRVGVQRGIRICSSDVTVRGLAMAGFTEAAIAVGVDAFSGCIPGLTNVRIEGNAIGQLPGASGATTDGGVLARQAVVSIGGATPAERNLIVANREFGVRVEGSASSGSVVQGNLIGVGVDGVAANVGNSGPGVELVDVDAVLVGGDGRRANRIGFNAVGVLVRGDAEGNTLDGNAYFGNDALGIDLSATQVPDGVSGNDPDDADGGPNRHQNFPMLASATFAGGAVQISGVLDVASDITSPEPYRITLYRSDACDPSGQGEGETPLGAHTLPLSAGIESFEFALEVDALAPGTSLSSTATDGSGNTSEFSACIQVQTADGAIFSNGFETP